MGEPENPRLGETEHPDEKILPAVLEKLRAIFRKCLEAALKNKSVALPITAFGSAAMLVLAADRADAYPKKNDDNLQNKPGAHHLFVNGAGEPPPKPPLLLAEKKLAQKNKKRDPATFDLQKFQSERMQRVPLRIRTSGGKMFVLPQEGEKASLPAANMGAICLLGESADVLQRIHVIGTLAPGLATEDECGGVAIAFDTDGDILGIFLEDQYLNTHHLVVLIKRIGEMDTVWLDIEYFINPEGPILPSLTSNDTSTDIQRLRERIEKLRTAVQAKKAAAQALLQSTDKPKPDPPSPPQQEAVTLPVVAQPAVSPPAAIQPPTAQPPQSQEPKPETEAGIPLNTLGLRVSWIPNPAHADILKQLGGELFYRRLFDIGSQLFPTLTASARMGSATQSLRQTPLDDFVPIREGIVEGKAYGGSLGGGALYSFPLCDNQFCELRAGAEGVVEVHIVQYDNVEDAARDVRTGEIGKIPAHDEASAGIKGRALVDIRIGIFTVGISGSAGNAFNRQTEIPSNTRENVTEWCIDGTLGTSF